MVFVFACATNELKITHPKDVGKRIPVFKTTVFFFNFLRSFRLAIPRETSQAVAMATCQDQFPSFSSTACGLETSTRMGLGAQAFAEYDGHSAMLAIRNEKMAK